MIMAKFRIRNGTRERPGNFWYNGETFISDKSQAVEYATETVATSVKDSLRNFDVSQPLHVARGVPSLTIKGNEADFYGIYKDGEKAFCWRPGNDIFVFLRRLQEQFPDGYTLEPFESMSDEEMERDWG